MRDHCGWTPLHEAANHDYPDVVKTLLDAGADINDRGGSECNGFTPLIDAAACGNVAVVKLLIQRGANVLAKDDKVTTCFVVLCLAFFFRLYFFNLISLSFCPSLLFFSSPFSLSFFLFLYLALSPEQYQ